MAAVRNGITLRGLCKEYRLGRTSVQALRNVDLEIASGSFVCVAGPSGSGKTTLLNLIGLIDTPTSGTVHVAGEDIQDGLRLVMMVQSKDYAREIVTVDVRNHGYSASRADPQIRMTARVRDGRSTDIRFGRFPVLDSGDYVVSPRRKIEYLDSYYSEHGRLAGLCSYLDLRYDELHASLN